MGMVLMIICYPSSHILSRADDERRAPEACEEHICLQGFAAVVTYYLLVPRPLCLVQARSTLSELDKSVVHPDVRKETDNCQEKGNKCP